MDTSEYSGEENQIDRIVEYGTSTEPTTNGVSTLSATSQSCPLSSHSDFSVHSTTSTVCGFQNEEEINNWLLQQQVRNKNIYFYFRNLERTYLEEIGVFLVVGT